MSNRKLLQTLREEGITIRQDEDGWYWERRATGDESEQRFQSSTMAANDAATVWDIEQSASGDGIAIYEGFISDGADPGDDDDYLKHLIATEAGSHYEGSWDDTWDLN